MAEAMNGINGINGNFGSAVQDAVVRAVALDLQRPLRETDILWSSWEENGQFQAAVGVPHVGLIVRGAWCTDRSQAELAASHSALVELQNLAKSKGQVPVAIIPGGHTPGPAPLTLTTPGLVQPNGAKSTKICKFFLKGWCYDGEKCPMMHGPTPKSSARPVATMAWMEDKVGIANHPGILKVGRIDGTFTPPTPTPSITSLTTLSKTELCSYFKKGWCYEGQKCSKAHGEEELGKPIQVTSTKKRSRDGEEISIPEKRLKSSEDTAEYEQWRDERLILGVDPDGVNAQSLTLWYAQICLICSTPISGLSNWPIHANGSKHMSRYVALGGAFLKTEMHRPDPQLQDAQPIPIQMSMYVQKQLGLAGAGAADGDIDVAKPGMAEFLSVAGFDSGMVLSIGEQDFSFSRSIAKVQASAGLSTQLVATSYLAEHDPAELEVHVADDGQRAQYTRKSLPSMGGALFKNLEAIKELGGIVLHSVDATDLMNTLVSQGVDGIFDVIVFAFPRASLKRSVEPRNSMLVRKFFHNVMEAGLLAPLGKVELLMLGTQYAEWDVACMAQEEGFELFEYAKLPTGFYQSREMTGKAWTPQNGMLYTFRQRDLT